MNIGDSRVLIIDDSREEVIKLIDLLNREGISYNYYSGTNKSELPSKPLSRVRFVFLDFVLGNDGQSDKTKISVLIANLKKLISRNNGPYVILTWTKNDTPDGDLIDLLKNELMKCDAIPNPLDIIRLEKTDSYNNILKIKKTIDINFQKTNIFNILLDWELNSFSAGTDVLNTIFDLVEINNDLDFKKYSKETIKQIEFYLTQIAKGAYGSNITEEEITARVQNSLSMLLKDNIERKVDSQTIAKEIGKKLHKHIKSKISSKKSASINDIFLLMKNSLSKSSPGNIYLHSEIISSAKKNKKENDCVQLKRIYKNYLSNFFDKKYSNTKLGLFSDYESDIKLRTTPIYLELTPSCDHANGKQKNVRLIFGLLVPEKYTNNSKTKEIKNKNIRKIGDSIFESQPIIYGDELYYIILDYAHYYSLHTSVLKDSTPLFRLREDFLYLIQKNVANHLSRPGIFGLELEKS